VIVGDRVVASKSKSGLLGKIVGKGGFPDEDEAVAAVRSALATA
jgi:hypothetical protein